MGSHFFLHFYFIAVLCPISPEAGWIKSEDSTENYRTDAVDIASGINHAQDAWKVPFANITFDGAIRYSQTYPVFI